MSRVIEDQWAKYVDEPFENMTEATNKARDLDITFSDAYRMSPHSRSKQDIVAELINRQFGSMSDKTLKMYEATQHELTCSDETHNHGVVFITWEDKSNER